MPFPPVPVAEAEAPARFSPTALDAVREELERIPERELLPISAHPFTAGLTVVGAVPKILEHRAEIEALCGAERAKLVDRLALLGHALCDAYVDHRLDAVGPNIEAISRAAIEQRTILLSDAWSLVHRGVLKRQRLDGLGGVRGYKSQIADILILVSLFQGEWPEIEAKTGLREADLHRAEGSANQLALALAARQFPTPPPSAALRQRAYTLLIRTYDEVRRMLSYVRWHEGDVAQIAPSLFAQRKRRKRTAPVEEAEAAVGGAVTASDGRGAAPGMPGSSPFIDA